jgi:monofunctional biosynthetic peptidoglycan transglycosylase
VGKLRLVRNTLAAVAAAAFVLLGYIYLTLPDVRPLATTNPQTTAWMEMRREEARVEGRKPRHEQRWVPYSRISPQLKRAVIVAEDTEFWRHEGIDLERIRESMEINLELGRPARGASTITQQLAKNLYLSPSRNPLRKLRELIIARRLEAELDKARILEIYLNVIEWGDGVWGAEAAARRYFGVSAAQLTALQAALLAGAIINPRVYNPGRPNARLLRRQRIVLRRMNAVVPPAPVGTSADPEPVDLTPTEELQPLPPSDPLLPPPEPRPCPMPPCPP